MSESNMTPEGAVMALAQKLLAAENKAYEKGHETQKATKQEIINAFKEAIDIVNDIRKAK